MKAIGLLIILFFNMMAFSQQAKIENIELKYMLKTKGKTDKIVFICIIPNNIPNVQEVTSINYSHEPSKSYEENENKYVEFEFLNVVEEILVINFQVKIFQNDLKTAINNPIRSNIIKDHYLHEEKFIESNASEIVKKARSLRRMSTLKTVINTYKFVNQNLKFDLNTPDNGALVALNGGMGKCQEFSDLFVALCRANGIPSRVTEGILTEYDTTPFHAWVEVYLKKYGWVRFDPTPGNAFSFSVLPNKYIKFSSLRSDGKIYNGHRWAWINWGDNVTINEVIKIEEQKN